MIKPGVRFVKFLFTLLIIAAILTFLFTIAVLALWWRGVKVILLPGIGLVISTPLIVLFLFIGEVFIVLVAILVSSGRGNP